MITHNRATSQDNGAVNTTLCDMADVSVTVGIDPCNSVVSQCDAPALICANRFVSHGLELPNSAPLIRKLELTERVHRV